MVAACLPALSWAQAPPAPAEQPPIRLSEGEVVSAALHAEAAAAFEFTTAPDVPYLIEVRQIGLDFRVTVEGPATAAVTFDSPLAREESEFVLLERGAGGAYRLTVTSDEFTEVEGSVAVLASRLAGDDAAAAAWASMTRGARAFYEGDAQGSIDAIAAYAAAAEQWHALGRAREEAQAVSSVAALEYLDADYERAAQHAAAAADLYAGLGLYDLAAGANHRRAAALIELVTGADEVGAETRDAWFAQSLRLLEDARAAYERSGNRYAAALAVNDMGVAHHVMGDLQLAKSFWLEATESFRALGERDAELTALSNKAVIDVEEGHLLDAIASLERVVDVLPADRLLDDRAWTLGNLAATHRLFGNFEQALQTYLASLALHRANGDVQGEAYALRGIGQSYYGLGELDLATEYLEAALPKAEQVADGRGREATVRYLGNVAFRQRNYEAAREYHETALGLATSPLDIAYLDVSLARDLAALGRHAQARDLADRARETAEATETRLLLGDALLVLGQSLSELGDFGAATMALERARSVYSGLELRGSEADALNALAVAARDRGDLDAALAYGDAALDAVEDLRARISHPELRAYNAALRRGYFDTQIGTLIQAQQSRGSADDAYLRAAFDVSERARTRMLVDLLNEAAVDLREGMDPSLTERRSSLYDRLAERSAQQDALVNQAAAEDASGEELYAVMGEMRALETEINVVEAQLRRANPRYADLSAPRTLTSSDVQAMLDARTVLIQYALADERSYVWLVGRDRLEVHELGGRDEIESAARRAFEELGSFRPSGDRRALDAALDRLATLVWTPIADSVDADRLLVAAGGALQYVPFGVLPDPIARTSDESARPNPVLLERYEIVVVPSMSGIAAQAARRNTTPPPKTIAVFVDPVMTLGDSRSEAFTQPSAQDSADGGPGGGRNGRGGLRGAALARLPWTAREAEAISALVPAGQRLVATGFAVTHDAVLGNGLEDYRYLHFATHGRIDSRHPELSALVLSQVDELGRPEARSELRLHDIYNLRLNADLVVLSACDTALGREVRGESLIGLTQGFVSAGAGSVAATLWQVPDRATAELMTRFYRFTFGDGLRPAEALRRAQLSIASERRTNDPYFWGAFIMVGDWR